MPTGWLTSKKKQRRSEPTKSPRGQLATAAGGQKANKMQSTKFLALVRGVKREAARWGYHGDVLTDQARIPLVGTVQQQHDQATIYIDVDPRPVNERERELLKRLIRAVVLTEQPATVVQTSCKRSDPRQATKARAW